jgi:hypothetical protein
MFNPYYGLFEYSAMYVPLQFDEFKLQIVLLGITTHYRLTHFQVFVTKNT